MFEFKMPVLHNEQNKKYEVLAFTNCMHVICTQTALHVHKNLYLVLIGNTIEKYLLPAHTDHYALR